MISLQLCSDLPNNTIPRSCRSHRSLLPSLAAKYASHHQTASTRVVVPKQTTKNLARAVQALDGLSRPLTDDRCCLWIDG